MSGGIYISYRREDASFLAGRLYDRLLEHFPQDKIFMDLDRVAHGEDLVKTIEKAIKSSDIPSGLSASNGELAISKISMITCI